MLFFEVFLTLCYGSTTFSYVLCELRVCCFLLKRINKWLFEANGLFCLYIYAIIPQQSCNNLPDVRLALYTH